MKLSWLLKKLPWRYLCALGILAIGLLFLGIYSLFKGNGSAPSTVAESTPVPPFTPAEVVLCGNALVSRSGEIIAKQWLEGFGDNPPNLKRISTADQLVIVASSSGVAGAFGFDGKAKPLPQADGKPIGAAAFNQSFTETVYCRDGNLWHCSVDWQNGTIRGPRKISDTGYFRPDVFRSTWLWHEGDLLVPHMGKTLKVELAAIISISFIVSATASRKAVTSDSSPVLVPAPEGPLNLCLISNITASGTAHSVRKSVFKPAIAELLSLGWLLQPESDSRLRIYELNPHAQPG